MPVNVPIWAMHSLHLVSDDGVELPDPPHEPRPPGDKSRPLGAPSFVEPQGGGDAVLHFFKAPGEHDRVLHRLAGALAQVWRRRMGSVTQERNALRTPTLYRLAVVDVVA